MPLQVTCQNDKVIILNSHFGWKDKMITSLKKYCVLQIFRAFRIVVRGADIRDNDGRLNSRYVIGGLLSDNYR